MKIYNVVPRWCTQVTMLCVLPSVLVGETGTVKMCKIKAAVCTTILYNDDNVALLFIVVVSYFSSPRAVEPIQRIFRIRHELMYKYFDLLYFTNRNMYAGDRRRWCFQNDNVYGRYTLQ